MTAPLPSLAGGELGQRWHHQWALDAARRAVAAAAFYRVLGDRDRACQHLDRAARFRRVFMDRTTPAPPPPTTPAAGHWEWSPMLRDWWDAPTI